MQLHYKKYGEQGQVIIILHGLLGSLDNWHNIAQQLSSQFVVYTLDLRNHGKSPHDNEFNYPVMAEDLKEFYNRHHIQQAFLIGHSLGGKIVMQFALIYSHLVKKIIVVDMAPKAYSSHHDEIFDALRKMDLQKIQSRKQAEEMMSQYISDVAVRQFLLKNLNRTESGNYEWKMNLPVIWKNYSKITEAVNYTKPFLKPALFIRGGNSSYIKDKDIQQIKAIFPEAEIFTVQAAGHWVHVNKPVEFINETRNFLLKD